MSKTTKTKEREEAVAAAREIPDDVLEAEMERRSTGNQRIERLLEFFREPDNGYLQHGEDIEFTGEDFIELLRRNWHMCLMSSLTKFEDIEGWLRRVMFGKDEKK